MGLSKQLNYRLTRLRQVAEALPRADQFGVIQAIPIANAGGRPLGLHRVGAHGSTGGALVYDPDDGPPQLPGDTSLQCDLFVVCEPASFQPGVDYADWGS
jgi:hypothetical protein